MDRTQYLALILKIFLYPWFNSKKLSKRFKYDQDTLLASGMLYYLSEMPKMPDPFDYTLTI